MACRNSFIEEERKLRTELEHEDGTTHTAAKDQGHMDECVCVYLYDLLPVFGDQ